MTLSKFKEICSRHGVKVIRKRNLTHGYDYVEFKIPQFNTNSLRSLSDFINWLTEMKNDIEGGFESLKCDKTGENIKI